MTQFVVGVWVVTLVWLLAGYLVFQLAIARSLRDKGVSKPIGFRTPPFIGSQTRELTVYRTQRLRAGRGLAWWRFMVAWRVLFGVLMLGSLLATLLAAFEIL